jgi:hypothetical protein
VLYVCMSMEKCRYQSGINSKMVIGVWQRYAYPANRMQ